ncbi:MAG: O-antigen ligase family protein [Elusimicrobia bacterium]|nr:O-antigen ligase family protein [Elusimicrobiota bacterium]
MKKIVSNTVLFIFGVLCVLYTIFYRNFAELHIKLSFLNFPIFISEIVLLISFLLFIIFFREYLINKSLITYSLYAYFAFVLVKALYGYFIWGPLAFRNAAMFYYVLFAVATFLLAPKISEKPKIFYILAIVLILAMFFAKLIRQYFLVYYLAFIILIMPGLRIKKIVPVLSIAAFIFFSYFILSTTVRALMVSYLIAVLFFMFCYSLFYLKSIRVKSIISIGMLGVLGVLFAYKADRNSIKSLLPVKEHYERFKEGREYSLRILNTKKRKDYNLKIYEKEREGEAFKTTSGDQEVKYLVYEPEKKEQLKIAKKEEKKKEVAKPVEKLREIHTAKNSLLWRMFVITDMLEEVAVNKKVFGMDFGKPFRSKTVEMLGWHDGWNVGWIEPHNSFVHIVYRAGVLGIVFIAAIIIVFVRILIGFIRLKNVQGLILMSVILYWLMMANFLVILELPYFAIPFWIFVGATFKYYDGLRGGRVK